MRGRFACMALFGFLAACSNAVDEQATADDGVAQEGAAAAQTMDSAVSDALCLDAGPQTPRDISNPAGLNTVLFEMAPPASEMNLCNIHTHTNAEHKGPGFSVFVDASDNGG